MAKKDKREGVTDYSVDHFIQRGLERYSLTLTKKHYDDLSTLLKKKIADGVPPSSSDANTDIYPILYKVNDQNVEFICVWNRKDTKITTLLPRNTQIRLKK